MNTGKVLAIVLSIVFFSLCSVQAQNFNMQLRSQLTWSGQNLANVCGYTAPNGNEYALVGGSTGLIIVNITNPDVPVEIVQIPGPTSQWKEIKVFQNYAYVASEGGLGLQIVDLSSLPTAPTVYKYYKGNNAIANQLDRIHALHIDVTTGYLYLFGANILNGRPLVFNLNPDPYNPNYVGSYANPNGSLYVHDGYVDNDTMYSGHIYAGSMNIVNMTNKTSPVTLGNVITPGAFTHNVWLTDDHETARTTDEVSNSYLTAYNISDPSNIQELDRIAITPGSGSIVHNTHVRNDYAVTSWYKDGVTIIDAHRPSNLVEVGRYDTWPQGSGNGFQGCWGAFPFFPSGTIIASNMNPATLFVLTPTYTRACYLEGIVTDSLTGLPLIGATITITGGPASSNTTSALTGDYKTGVPAAGTYTVTYSINGYVSKTFTVNLTAGNITLQNAPLVRPLCATQPVITGQSTVPINGVMTYGVSPISGATYVWTVTGGTIVSGQGTANITVQWSNGVAGTVSIVQTNP